VTFPLFLKPITGGDSRGINAESVVFDFKKYQAKVLDIYNNQKSYASRGSSSPISACHSCVLYFLEGVLALPRLYSFTHLTAIFL